MPTDSDCRADAARERDALPLAALIAAVCAAVDTWEAEFTRLDQAIGDGDHGANLRRGARALRARAAELSGQAPGAALRECGMALVLSVGGASGPLYGGFLIGLGQGLEGGASVACGLEQGLAAVRRRGRSEAGDKTLLDVLVPVIARIGEGAGGAAVRRAADEGFAATRDLVAARGRAAYLGERSRGHCDPGAASARRFVHAVCDVMENIR